MILIHHIGARSGTERVNPLVYLPDCDDMIIAETKGGAPRKPDWYHNLKAHPRITVEVGTAIFPVEATEAIGDERSSLWRRLVEMLPGFAAYETKTSCILPMFKLTRLPEPFRHVLADHDANEVDVRARDRGHYRRVDHPHVRDGAKPHWSTTAIGSPTGPIRPVPQGWNWVARVART